MPVAAAHAPDGTGDAGRARARALGAAVVAVVAGAVYLPAMASVGLRTDTAAHLRFAGSMALTGREYGPYYLFEQLTIIVRALIPFGALSKVAPSLGDPATIWDVSGMVVLLAFVAGLAVLVDLRLAGDLDRAGARHARTWAGVLTICLLLVAPVTVLTWHRHQLLVGYISVTSFESATVIVARPLALALFWVVADRMWSRQPARVVAATAALSLVALHAKPSYAICLLPATGLFVAWRWWRDRGVDPRMWWWGFAVPSVVGLVYQVAVSRGQGGIGVAPFEIVRQLLESRGLSAWWFLPLLALSVLFPAVVAVVERDHVRASRSTGLAWAAFAVGIAVFCTFTVTGRRDYGDLVWGPQIGLFVLMVESARLAAVAGVERARAAHRTRPDARTLVVGAALALHVLCGLVLWYHEIVEPAAWW